MSVYVINFSELSEDGLVEYIRTVKVVSTLTLAAEYCTKMNKEWYPQVQYYYEKFEVEG